MGNGEVVVITSCGIMVTLKFFDAVRAGVLESVAVTVTLNVPAKVGVPEMEPVAARTRPGGRVEPAWAAQDQTIGGAPPVDVRVAL